MLFPTFEFLYFFTFVLILNWFLKKWPLLWKLFLLIASYYFYFVWDVRFLAILIGVSVFNFLTSRAIAKNYLGRKQFFFVISIVVDVFVLGLFKYYDFFRVTFESLFLKIGLPFSFPLLEIILPLGLSFYILRSISYNIDTYSDKIPSLPSFLDVLLYIAFFPQLLAGPIMRAPEFFNQLQSGGAKKIENVWESFANIVLGIFKKIVISSYLVVNITDNVFAVPANHSPLVLILAMLAYTIVIYFDFSAYSDMSIGFAGLLGFTSPINFDGPYLSLSPQDFWRRWHITLSSWFRDYVYIPLGGNRKGFLRKYLNLIFVMVLAGLWHGAALHFIIWGALHGLGLVVVHSYRDYKKRKNYARTESANSVTKFFCWLATFIFICFTWIFFRANTTADALTFIQAIFHPLITVEPVQLYVILVTLFGVLFFIFEKQIFRACTSIQQKLPVYLSAVLIILCFILIFELGPNTVPPFIYFGF